MKHESIEGVKKCSSEIQLRQLYAAVAELDWDRVTALLNSTSDSDVFIKEPPAAYIIAGIMLEAPVETIQVLETKIREYNLIEHLDKTLVQMMCTYVETQCVLWSEGNALIERLLKYKQHWPQAYAVVKVALARLVEGLAGGYIEKEVLIRVIGQLVTAKETPLLEMLIKVIFRHCDETTIRSLTWLVDRRQAYIIRDLQWAEDLPADKRLLAYHLYNDPIDDNPEPQESFIDADLKRHEGGAS